MDVQVGAANTAGLDLDLLPLVSLARPVIVFRFVAGGRTKTSLSRSVGRGTVTTENSFGLEYLENISTGHNQAEIGHLAFASEGTCAGQITASMLGSYFRNRPQRVGNKAHGGVNHAHLSAFISFGSPDILFVVELNGFCVRLM